MLGDRIRILVEVNTDLVPGWGYDPNDYVALVERLLNERISHYNPVVTLLPTEDPVLPAGETERSGP
jgi:hypothetical protein